MKLVHWPLMGGLLHLVQRGETGRGRSPHSLLIAVPNVTAHPSTLSTRQHKSSRTRASSTGDSLISGEVSYTGWMLSTGFGSEFASRCSDVCTGWLLNTCLPTANPSPASLAVSTCDRLTVIQTATYWASLNRVLANGHRLKRTPSNPLCLHEYLISKHTPQ